ncbi:MAG: sodium/proline symporter PutP [Wolinella sp.]
MNLDTVVFSFPVLITFGAYTLVMLYIGFYFYRRTNNTEEYFLGGRSLGAAVSALSAGASDMSGWLLMGLPGALYVGGVAQSYIAIGLTIGAFINWSFVAKRLRVYTGSVAGSITIPDYFETRFSDSSHALRIISALIILVFFTIYTSAGLVGGAKLLEGTFGLNYHYALVIGSIIIVSYTFFGGYLAVCWTDMLQGLLMMGALLVIPTVMLSDLGGFGEAFVITSALDESKVSMGSGVTFIGIISSLAWGLGYFGQPHILVRFMSIRSTREIPTATVIGILWMSLSLLGACLLGFLGIAYVEKFNLTLRDPEQIFIVMSQLLFNPWVSGILLSAILAAIMSTVSSQLLVSSSTIAEDFYRKLFHTQADPKLIMRFSRASVLVVALIAFIISLDKNSSILKIVAYAWAGFGASFGSVILFSLFWGRMTRLGAICGMLSGAVTVILYKNFISPYFDIYEIIPGFLMASFAIVFVSLFQPVREGTKEAFTTLQEELKRH